MASQSEWQPGTGCSVGEWQGLNTLTGWQDPPSTATVLAQEEDQEGGAGWMVQIWKDHRAELGKGPVCRVEVRDESACRRSQGLSVLAWSSDWGEPKQGESAICPGC